MDVFETGDPLEPVIYISQDRSCVFVQPNPDNPHEVHPATPTETTALWQRHRIIALLAVMKITESARPSCNPGDGFVASTDGTAGEASF
jgi:hypothetical protein